MDPRTAITRIDERLRRLSQIILNEDISEQDQAAALTEQTQLLALRQYHARVLQYARRSNA